MSATVVLTETTVHTSSTGTTLTSHGMPAEDTPTGREKETIVFNDCCSGLGIKIIGGISEDDEDDGDYGIFIRKVLPGGLAHQDGHLQEGDQVFEVNGESLLQVTNSRAVSLLRQASAQNYVELVVCRDEQAREEYLELLDAYTYSSASSVSDRQSISSRASTASVHSQQWGDALSQSYSSVSQTRTSPYGQTGDQLRIASSSGSDQDLTPTHSSPPTLDISPGSTAMPTQPKIPNAAAASMQRQGLLMGPAMSSTPQDGTGYVAGGVKHSAPDGASGLSVGSQAGGYDPSPVVPSHSQNGAVHSDYLSTHSPSRLHAAPSQHTPTGRSTGPQLHSRKLALDPHVRLRVEKLEVALRYLGLEPTDEQFSELRCRLNIDHTGSVTYGAFVRAAREVFKFQLEERNISQGAMLSAASDIRDFTDPPAFKPEMSHVPELPIHDEMERLRRERDELRNEVQRLKEKEKIYLMTEDELLRVRREAQGALHESRSLRSKYQLAEQAQRAARSMEQDYEEVVRLLEKEIAELRAQQSKELDSPAVQRRLAVLGCQLRKAEVGKKTYEVATEKLLQFVELVHESLSGPDSLSRPNSSQGELTQGVHPPGYISKHSRHSPQALASEAREVVKTVKALIEVEPLPFGWEEAYTADGMRYYINHVTQITVWHHPLTNVQHGVTSMLKQLTNGPQSRPASGLNPQTSPKSVS